MHGALPSQRCRSAFHAPCIPRSSTRSAGRHELRLVDADAAYDALVEQPSFQYPEHLPVVPGDPERSLLWLKTAPGIAVCGYQMPPDCFGDDCGLATAEADLVRDWIAAGARR